VDAKSQIQALDRAVPVLPMQPGSTTCFVALDIATGQVNAALKQRHSHQEFLAFLKQIERTYRLVVDQATGSPSSCTW
jgi:hypothetical protein